MANSLREVKTRIDSTKSTKQITKAMYMVSQSKVKKAERTYKDYKDFMQRISDMVASIVSKASDDYSHPMLKKREIKKTAYLIVTSDRGLAGAYNSSLFKALETKILQVHKSNEEFICGSIGKKGYGFLKSKGYDLFNDHARFVRDDVMFLDIVPAANDFIEMFLNNEIDELIIVYNHYVNSLTQDTTFKTLLPISEIDGNQTEIDYIYESGIEHTIDMVLPMYIQDMIYGIILDAKTSEHSARMTSMRNATDNADEVIGKLQLLYNRARQEVITNELTDIIGGANAIGGNK